ncbi:MAG: fumarate hydratase, partial [Rhodospirillaceae bacterium]|nr:fumarate hydratase [Rhodospirillaceae bacterium]
MLDAAFAEIFPLAKDTTPYRKITADGVSVQKFRGKDMLIIQPSAITQLTAEAFRDLSHLLRPGHLQQLRNIMDDKEASPNDRFVALELLKNANIAAGFVLPMCQDTGTAIVMGKKGQQVFVDGDDAMAISEGVADAYNKLNLRYSQMSPISLFEEKNTGNNLPAQLDLLAVPGDSYKFMFMAKGGGSANKSYLFQRTKSLLNPVNLKKFLDEEIRHIGTSACPPYHLAIVIGGTSAEMTLKTVKLASARYLDGLPTKGGMHGQAFRDLDMEAEVLEMTRKIGIGAQFGGKYYCHDVRVIRLPRHGASCPVGIGVSCSADRQVLGKITRDGVYVEQLETNPAQFLPEVKTEKLSSDVVKIDLNQPMDQIR